MLCELWISYKYLKAGQGKKFITFSTFISIIGITLGVCVLIVVISVMSGFDKYLEDKMIGTNSHIFVKFSKVEDTQSLAQRLKNIPHVLAVSPIIQGNAFLKIYDQINALQINGIDPRQQENVTKIKEYLVKGSFYIKGNELLIGQEFADILGVGIDDEITLISSTTLKSFNFKIKGIFKTGMYIYDSGMVLTSIPSAKEFLNIHGAVKGFNIKLDNIYMTQSVKNEIIDKFMADNLYMVRTWIDANRNFLHALKLEKIVMFVVVAMTTVVAAFGIIGTLVMSIMTKIKDIGILRSIGAKARSILMIFLFKGIFLGLLGIVLGVVSGYWLSKSLNRIVDFISSLIGRNLIPKEVYYFDRLPTNVNINDIAIIVSCAFLIVLMASLYPAIYASKINPANALRHE